MKVLKKRQLFSYIGSVFALFVASILLSSCLSTSRTYEEDRNYLGDFDPIQLENVFGVRESGGKLKPVEIRLFFIPRTNNIEAYLRDGSTAYILIFERQERDALVDGIMAYIQAYATYADGNTRSLPTREANRKNYFTTGTMSVSWGIANPARNNTSTFQTNYMYLEKNRPYFELMVESTIDTDEPAVTSPVLRLYFTPIQLEAFLIQIDQENLEKLVYNLEDAAFSF